MGKDQIFTGQPILSQLLSYIDRNKISRLCAEHDADRYYKRFRTYDHLVTMLYAIYHKCTSIREVTTGMQACFQKLNHLGLTYSPRRSTLSDANRNRSSDVFEAIHGALYDQYRTTLPDSRSKKKWFSRLFIIDSTTISLFKEILKNAGTTPANGRRKGGIKVHTLIKADQDVPCLVKMTAAASHDIPFIRGLKLPKRSIVTFDKGYVSYDQYDLWTKEGVYWVTRMRQGTQYEIIKQRPVSEAQQKKGVLSDQVVILGHQSHNNVTRTKARLIVYHDNMKDRVFQFITNNLRISASNIALIYQHRWQIELLFKRIKQNYPLQYFLGDNENAIRIQIWCVLIADLIIKLVKSRLRKRWSYANLNSMIRIHLMSYIHLIKFLENPDKLLINNIQIMNKGPSLFD